MNSLRDILHFMSKCVNFVIPKFSSEGVLL